VTEDEQNQRYNEFILKTGQIKEVISKTKLETADFIDNGIIGCL